MAIIKLLSGIFGLAFGVFVLVRAIRKNRTIDTESIAIVKEVINLGRSDGRTVYAIKYDIKSSEPFELLVTPCKKALPIGKDRSVFYEKADAKHNYYFKTIGQFDTRLIMPTVILLSGVVVTISSIVELLS